MDSPSANSVDNDVVTTTTSAHHPAVATQGPRLIHATNSPRPDSDNVRHSLEAAKVNPDAEVEASSTSENEDDEQEKVVHIDTGASNETGGSSVTTEDAELAKAASLIDEFKAKVRK